MKAPYAPKRPLRGSSWFDPQFKKAMVTRFFLGLSMNFFATLGKHIHFGFLLVAYSVLRTPQLHGRVKKKTSVM